jgi:hypothetical protein
MYIFLLTAMTFFDSQSPNDKVLVKDHTTTKNLKSITLELKVSPCQQVLLLFFHNNSLHNNEVVGVLGIIVAMETRKQLKLRL